MKILFESHFCHCHVIALQISNIPCRAYFGFAVEALQRELINV